jgi:hypothetical protein
LPAAAPPVEERDGRTRTVAATWLVGCDGAASRPGASSLLWAQSRQRVLIRHSCTRPIRLSSVATPRLPATDGARLAGMSYMRFLAYLRSGEIAGEQRGRD